MISYSIALRTSNPIEYNAAQLRIAAAKAAGRQPLADDLAVEPIVKAYGVAQYSQITSLSQFARHIADHGSVYSRGDVMAILTMAVDCLREKLLAGEKIEMGELGTFSVTLQTSGAPSADKFSASNIKRVKVNWTPGLEFQNLLSDAEFKVVSSRAVQAKVKAQLKLDPNATIIDLSDGANSGSGSGTGGTANPGSGSGSSSGSGTGSGGSTPTPGNGGGSAAGGDDEVG